MQYYMFLAGGSIGAGVSYNGQIPPGAVECTLAQYQAPASWTIANGVVAPYTPTVAQALQAAASSALSAGITITSTGTPALNGTYSVDAAAQSNIQAVQIYVQANGKFPGSSGTYPWLDKDGAAHVFPSIAEFTSFATAIADFVADIKMILLTGAGTLPATTATIP